MAALTGNRARAEAGAAEGDTVPADVVVEGVQGVPIDAGRGRRGKGKGSAEAAPGMEVRAVNAPVRGGQGRSGGGRSGGGRGKERSEMSGGTGAEKERGEGRRKRAETKRNERGGSEEGTRGRGGKAARTQSPAAGARPRGSPSL